MAQPNVQTVGKLGGEDLGGSVREDDPVAHAIGNIVHEVLAVGGIDVAVATVRHIIRALYLVLELIVHCLHMNVMTAISPAIMYGVRDDEDDDDDVEETGDEDGFVLW
uniref:Uncharacterized protein n=1 Tax=Anopheles coluzzii TaxID=1518534 RepID=A0A8W7Q267_ANOCL